MNDEQNTPEEASKADKEGSKVFLADSSLQSNEEFKNDKESKDDYYEVDNPKKEVMSTIGDGEMHNEGMVGDGSAAAVQSPTEERLPDEQDKAELRDAQG